MPAINGHLVHATGVQQQALLATESILENSYALLECNEVDIVRLEHGIDLWVDAEGAIKQKPQLNLRLTILAHALGHPALIFGHGLIFGAAEDGVTELDTHQLAIIRNTIEQTPTETVVDSVAAMLWATEDAFRILHQL